MNFLIGGDLSRKLNAAPPFRTWEWLNYWLIWSNGLMDDLNPLTVADGLKTISAPLIPYIIQFCGWCLPKQMLTAILPNAVWASPWKEKMTFQRKRMHLNWIHLENGVTHVALHVVGGFVEIANSRNVVFARFSQDAPAVWDYHARVPEHVTVILIAFQDRW